MSRIVIIGPGRAGMSIGLAATSAGHTVSAVLARRPVDDLAASLGCEAGRIADAMPTVDIVLVAVSDDAIAEVAAQLSETHGAIVAHLSGRTSISVLARFGDQAGCFHPLQSLPTPEIGRQALAGSGAAITGASEPVSQGLFDFARSLGMEPFSVADEDKPTYHAAASAASNFLVTTLGVAETLFDEAGVPLRVAAPLIYGTAANVLSMGARAALTGPIARGDVETVRAQRRAARSAGIEETFLQLCRATSRLAGNWDVMEEVLS